MLFPWRKPTSGESSKKFLVGSAKTSWEEKLFTELAVKKENSFKGRNFKAALEPKINPPNKITVKNTFKQKEGFLKNSLPKNAFKKVQLSFILLNKFLGIINP